MVPAENVLCEKPTDDNGLSGGAESGRDDTSGKEEGTSPVLSPSDEETGDAAAALEDGHGLSSPRRRPGSLFVLRRMWDWVPPPARYDLDNPPKFTLALNLLFAFATTFTVANLYYNQAILNKIAETFDVTFERASSIATLMQAGYAAGILFICPLGDIFRRRPFILGLIAFTATLWLGLCLTTSFEAFSVLSFACGATTVTPQLMLPLVGDLAPLERRASSISLVVSGLALGMLAARVLSGIVANYADWRSVYWFGFAAQYLTLALLWVFLPDYPSKNPAGLNYLSMLWSILRILVVEPLLVQACLVTFLISAVFTSFWTTLSFLLASPPYGYSPVSIGLFGLVGVLTVCVAPVYSRLLLDHVVPLFSTVLGQLIELAGVAAGTFTATASLAGPIVQAVAIDIGGQGAQIANRAAIYSIRPDAINRVNTAYMLAGFVGQLTGTAVGNRLYAEGGWPYSSGCSIALTGASLIVCFARGPRETGWVGWSGGWRIWRDDLGPKPGDAAEQSPAPDGVVREGGGSTEKPRD